MTTKTEQITVLVDRINKKSARIKKLKLEGGRQSTQICVLKLRIKELEGLVGELYDEAACEKAGEWVLENKELQKKVKQALKGGIDVQQKTCKDVL